MNLEQEFLEWHNAVVTALNTSVRFLAALGLFGCSKVANMLAEVRKTWRNPHEVTPDTLRLPAIEDLMAMVERQMEAHRAAF
jgi:hypothetical protein